ncbi:acyltransferase family protein [Aliinostoc sp. HNIBRCY26]|uniref:acyltransferase family protein n=1 Tax=Aliinostoc sp. HNIBRCY26 TaxID=3418997 RepID=UPI003D05B66F
MTTDVKHIKPLTSMRGIAALSVAILHFSYYGIPKTGDILSAHTAFFYNSYLWVDFFFILSGFIMTHVYFSNFASGVNLHKYGSYLISRFARIYPLHIFMIVLFIGLEVVKYLLQNTSSFTGKFNLTALFANIFMLQAFDFSCPPWFKCDTYWNEPAWSISVEFLIYSIFPCLLFLLLKNRHKFDLKIYITALITMLPVIIIAAGNLDNIIGIPSIARCGLECIIGIITYKFHLQGTYKKYFEMNLIGVISIIWILLIMHNNWGDSRVVRSVHDWLVLPGFSLLILYLSNNRNGLISKILSLPLMVYLGAISYSIYMTHWFIQELFRTFWNHKFHVYLGTNLNEYESWMCLCLFILVVLATASITYSFVEIPMRKYLKEKLLNKQYLHHHLLDK